MEGGSAKIYHCNDSDKCLKVVADATVTIASDKALKNQISKLLNSIQNKAVADEKLTEQEKGFISSTTIPVFKYTVNPQMLGVSNSLLYQLTDYIGYDILLQYIRGTYSAGPRHDGDRELPAGDNGYDPAEP